MTIPPYAPQIYVIEEKSQAYMLECQRIYASKPQSILGWSHDVSILTDLSSFRTFNVSNLSFFVEGENGITQQDLKDIPKEWYDWARDILVLVSEKGFLGVSYHDQSRGYSIMQENSSLWSVIHAGGLVAIHPTDLASRIWGTSRKEILDVDESYNMMSGFKSRDKVLSLYTFKKPVSAHERMMREKNIPQDCQGMQKALQYVFDEKISHDFPGIFTLKISPKAALWPKTRKPS